MIIILNKNNYNKYGYKQKENSIIIIYFQMEKWCIYFESNSNVDNNT